MEPTLNYNVTAPSGQQQEINDVELAQQLAASGVNILDKTPDGTHFIMDDGQGRFATPAALVWQKLGYKIDNITPINPDESGVDFGHRWSVEMLGNDGQRRDYLASKLRSVDNPNPQLMGGGSDWYTFDPTTGQYKALTNKKGWDMSDVAQYLPQGIKAAGSIGGAVVGGALTAPSGPGAIAGVAGGAALGSMIPDAAMRGLTAAVDPDFRREATVLNQAGQVGLEGAVSGALGGAGRAIGGPAIGYAAKNALLPAGERAVMTGGEAASNMAQKAMTTGPLSTVARGLGWSGEKGGGALDWTAGKIAGSPLARDVAAGYASPVVGGGGQAVSALGQLPAGAMTHAPGLIEKAAKSKLVQALLGEEKSTAIGQFASDIGKKSASPGNLFQRINQAFRKPGTENALNAGDVGRNVGQKVGGWLGKDISAVSEEAQARAAQDIEKGSAQYFAENPEDVANMFPSGNSAAINQGLAEEAGTRAASAATQRNADLVANAGDWGEQFGKGAETLASGARAVGSAVDTTANAVLRSAQGIGKVSKYGGSALKNAGTAAQPFENYLYARQYLTPKAEEQLSRLFPYKKRAQQGKLVVEN